MSININEKLYPQNAGKGALKKKDIVNRKTIKDTFQAIFFSSLLYPVFFGTFALSPSLSLGS